MPPLLQCPQPAPANHAQLYELLVAELTDSAVFLTDPTGCIVSWNPGVERLLGYPEAEWLGQSAHIIFTPEDRATGVPEQELATATREGRAPDVRWHQRKDGSRLFVDGTMVALKDHTGQLLGFSKVMRDVTPRWQAEEALRASAQRFRALLNASSDALYRMSPDWTEMRQLGGGGFIPDTESLNPDWLQEYIHPDDQPSVLAAIQQAVQSHNVFDLEHRVRRVDGTLGWTHSRAVPLYNAQGELTEWFGAARDITATKAAEEERERLLQQIEAERQRLEQVFAQAPVAICVLRGRELVYELANSHHQELLPNRALLGRPLLEAIPELDPTTLGIIRGVLGTGEPFAIDELLVPLDRDQDGIVEEIWFNLAYHPLREPDNTVSGVVVVAVEVTSQVRARQDLEQLNRSLEEFAYVASHDLQEPLRTVNIYTQLLLQHSFQEDSEAEEYAGFIRSSVTRMETLIRDLLSFSRAVHQHDLPTGTADLSAALAEAVSVLRLPIEESGAQIRAPFLPTVPGDTAQLTQVFQNLLSNSLKYRQPDQVPLIHFSAQQEGERWVITVRDNGIGFDPQYAERIFGLFKRLHRDEYPGTGVGLAICQRIIERYGGKMWAESQLGQGATFYFSLPRSSE